MQLTMVVDQVGIPVVCYGLRTDFRGEPFEGSMYLLAWAEQLTEIKAVCGCGRKATMNARIGTDGNRVVAGAQICIGHHYRAMARKCFCLPAVSPIEYEAPVSAPGQAPMVPLTTTLTKCAEVMADVSAGGEKCDKTTETRKPTSISTSASVEQVPECKVAVPLK